MFCCSVLLLVWFPLIGPFYIYLHVEILYCMFFFTDAMLCPSPLLLG